MQLKDYLNSEQLQAAEHLEGPMLVIAGAGSGKTRIIIYRIAYLMELGTPAEEILAVTFTNKSADEMRMRIYSLLQKRILACTFHSLGARILRESIHLLGYTTTFTIFDEEDSEKTLKECFQMKNLKEDRGTLKTIRGEISAAKNNLCPPEDPLAKELYELYTQKLKSYNALDFDDLLFLTVTLFQNFPETRAKYQNRWRFILVDEYQDTNQAQYLLLKLLSSSHQNVFAVGDPDQSIYSWRGANIENILHFEKDYLNAKTVYLEQNYRSTKNILDAANALIVHNENRYEKNLWSNQSQGELVGLYICESDKQEVQFVIDKLLFHYKTHNIPFSQCVIFYRTHFQSRVFEDALLREDIPYVIVGGISFYMRKEIKDLLAFLKVAHDGADFVSFARTLSLLKNGIGPSTQTKIFSAGPAGPIFSTCQAIIEGKLLVKLSQKQIEGLRQYVDILYAVRKLIAQKAPIKNLLEEILEKTNYFALLKEDPDTFQDRKENIEELLSKAVEWQQENETYLSAFLEELVLKSSPEQAEVRDTLKLMTLHNGKGLEFSVTFLVGMEEELFPHANSLGSLPLLEEERRLCYVGMTRAKSYLYLSAAKTRFLWGTSRFMRPSRFLAEIPNQYIKKFHREAYSDFSDSSSSFISSSAIEQMEISDHVFHKDFGRGVVQKVYQTSLGLTYDVLFLNEQDMRSLVAKFAKLTKL